MRIIFTSFILLLALSSISAQSVSDFESLVGIQDTFLNGEDGTGGFQTNNAFFPNTFEDFGTFTSWSGWSMSTITDNQTVGLGNQYSVISGEGVNDSQTYGITFVAGQSIVKLNENIKGTTVDGFFINNGTYPYFSMLEGDAFAKKFGGETGDDPDFFKLTIKKYLNGSISQDSIDFYLADYRDSDNTKDYIINEWTYIDLKPLGDVDSLAFTLSSSDNGAFGMNTPAYFCIDDFTTLDISTNTNEIDVDSHFQLYPNPTSNFVTIETNMTGRKEITIIDLKGRMVHSDLIQDYKKLFNFNNLTPGIYTLSISNNKEIIYNRLIIN